MDTPLRDSVTSVFFLLVYLSIKCKATVCPNSFNLIHGKCIQYNNNKIPWSGARSDCRGKGGDLISITSQAIYQELKTYCERSNKLSDRVLWVGAEEKGTGTFRWLDGRSCCAGWWAPNEPNGHGRERCVHYVDRSDGKGAALNDGDCSVSWAFVCESPACNSVNHCVKDNQECNGLATSQHRCKNCTQSYYSAGWGFGCKASVCPNGAKEVGNICLRYHEGSYVWSQARSYCKSNYGTDLLVVYNNAIFRHIQNAVLNRKDHGFCVGARQKGNQFEWVNSSPCCGSYWNPFEPNGGPSSEYCVHVWNSGSARGLNDNTCNDKIGFICEEHRKGKVPRTFGTGCCTKSDVRGHVSDTIAKQLNNIATM